MGHDEAADDEEYIHPGKSDGFAQGKESALVCTAGAEMCAGMIENHQHGCDKP
jgi:hypothetical protein